MENQDELWTSKDAAAYLRYSVKNFCDRIMPLPGFPKPIRLPSIKGGRGQPRWEPEAIKQWAQKYKEAA